MLAFYIVAAEHFFRAGLLTLVIPLGVLIVVAIWYVVAFRRGGDEG